jgi:hypothetical protein
MRFSTTKRVIDMDLKQHCRVFLFIVVDRELIGVHFAKPL